MPALMTIDQFMYKYWISRSTIYRLRKRGILPSVRIGRSVRIRVVDAERWYQSLLQDVGCK